jgi:hypothetical protein
VCLRVNHHAMQVHLWEFPDIKVMKQWNSWCITSIRLNVNVRIRWLLLYGLSCNLRCVATLKQINNPCRTVNVLF